MTPQSPEWFKSNIKLLLDSLGIDPPVPCRGCSRPIRWIVTKNGKKAPITDEGLNHFADCEKKADFRR